MPVCIYAPPPSPPWPRPTPQRRFEISSCSPPSAYCLCINPKPYQCVCRSPCNKLGCAAFAQRVLIFPTPRISVHKQLSPPPPPFSSSYEGPLRHKQDAEALLDTWTAVMKLVKSKNTTEDLDPQRRVSNSAGKMGAPLFALTTCGQHTSPPCFHRCGARLVSSAGTPRAWGR